MSYSKKDQTKRLIEHRTRTELNKIANEKLFKLWLVKNIQKCERCGTSFNLTNSHRHKRKWYYDKPDELLWDFNQVIRLCLKCHMEIEYNADKTDKLFKILRDEDDQN